MRTIILSIMAGVPTMVMAQSKPFEVTGRIAEIDAKSKIYLATMIDPKAILDSSTVENGHFKFKGELDEPKAFVLVASSDPSKLTLRRSADAKIPDFKWFYLDAGKSEIVSSGKMKDAEISGASVKVNKENDEYKQVINEVMNINGSIGSFYNNSSEETRKTEDFKKEYDNRIAEADKTEKELLARYIKSHPQSVISLTAIQRYTTKQPVKMSELKELFNSLSSSVRESKSGKAYAEILAGMERTAIGSVGPDFTQPDANGKEVKLSEFRGKYVLLEFWASWCVPCRKENPNLVNAYNKYKDKNFTVLAVSLDSEKQRDAWLTAIEKDNLTWNHVADLKGWDNAAAGLYSVRSIPANFLIDPNGKIIAKNLRGVNLHNQLEKILK